MKKSISTKALCIQAIMVALYVGFDYLATLTSTLSAGRLKISLSGLPVILCAVLFGPLSGMMVGLLGSFIGQMLSFGFSATTVLWILPAGIRGLFMGLLFIAFRRSIKFPVLCLEVVISSLLVTAFNTLAIYVDSVVYGYYSYALVVGGLVLRVVTGVATAVVLTVLLLPIYKAVRDRV